MMLDVKNVVVDFVTREAFRKQSASYSKYALKNHGRMDKEIAQKGVVTRVALCSQTIRLRPRPRRLRRSKI
jgi:hypothetical protein